MRKRIIYVLMSIMLISQLYAQDAVPVDTTKKHPRFQFGIGGYMGTHNFTSEFDDVTGSDKGIFIRSIVNLNKTFSISADIRYIDRSGVVNLRYYTYAEIFRIKGRGFQIPLLFSYKINNKKRKEIVSLSAGIAYQYITYQTSYNTPPVYPALVTTAAFRYDKDTKAIEYFSGLLVISKQFRLTKRNFLGIFYEQELSLNHFYIEDLTYSKDVVNLRQKDPLKPYSYKFGCYLIL